jgi:hypothetical protein
LSVRGWFEIVLNTDIKMLNGVINPVILPALTCISGFFIPIIPTYSLKRVTITEVID